MVTWVSPVTICLTSLDSPTPKGLKNTFWMQRSPRNIVYKPTLADFVPKFAAMATRVGRGRICLVSFNSPTPKTPVIRKDLWDISYIGRVIADFVPNFVAMATGVGRSRIFLASFNSPTPKTPCYTQRSRGYHLYKPSYSQFCPKFRCHGNRGHSGVNLNDAIK